MINVKIKHVIILLTSLIFILATCTPKVRYNVLSSVFDGVPPPANDFKMNVGIDTLGQVDSLRILALSYASRTVKFNYHEPFRDKKCASCHDDKHLGQMVLSEPDMCFQCHDERTIESIYNHGPTGAGYCTSCHEPHKSKAEHLLFEDGEKLCYICHSEDIINRNKIHKDIKDRNCVSCHSPHSSKNVFMLKDGTCYKCHDDTTGDYSFLHGPVSAGYCSSCHGSHYLENNNLLILTGNSLCFNCHDTSTTYKNDIHRENQDEDCLNCHNPHGGENEFLLK